MAQIATRRSFSALFGLLVIGLVLIPNLAHAQSPDGAEPNAFSRHLFHAKRSDYQALHEQLNGTGFFPVSIQSPANSRYNVVWNKDINVERYAIHTNMSRDSYEDRRDEYKRKRMKRSFVTAYSHNGEVRYNAIWVKETDDRDRRVHSKLSEKELVKKLKSYGRRGYSPVDILPWRHKKEVYYSAVWIKDKRDAAWIVDVPVDEWEKFHKEKRQQGYSLRDIGMLGASSTNGIRYSGVWVKDKATRTHFRKMGLTTAEVSSVLAAQVKDNYRVSDLDSVYVGDEIRFSVLLHRPGRRNRLIANFDIPEDMEDILIASLEEYRLPGRNGRSGNIGFFIENFETGRYIAYNPDQPFFISSTRKVILAASALQNGFKPSTRRSIDLDIENYRFDAREEGQSRGGIEYPRIDRRRMSSKFAPSDLLAAMLVESDNTAADYFYENWAGMRELRKTLESLDTRNFGEMISKCEQDRRSLMVKPGFDDLSEVRCHVLREWVTNPGERLRYANADEREILDGKLTARSESVWREHINKHYNALTPRTFARFFRSIAEEELLTRRQRGQLLSHMGTSSNFTSGLIEPRLFDSHAAKNGRTYRNKTWVGFTWDWRGRRGDYDRIRPKHAFVILTEDHSEPGSAASDNADLFSSVLFQRVLPLLDIGNRKR
ncbi:MAG: serine hydrolase [Pseudomonadota bacterium]